MKFFIDKNTLERMHEFDLRRTTGLTTDDIQPDHLEGTNFAIAIDCPIPQVEEWETTISSYVLNADGYYHREITVQDNPLVDKNAIIMRRYDDAITTHLNQSAHGFGYDNHYTMIGFRGSNNPRFNAEGEAMFQYRDEVWTLAHQWLKDYSASPGNERPTPTEVVERLPQLVVNYL